MSDKKLPTPEEVAKEVISRRYKERKAFGGREDAQAGALRIMTNPDEDGKNDIIECMKSYAKEVVKHTLQEAAEQGTAEDCHELNGDVYPIIDKQSILSLEDKIIKDLGL